MEIGLSGVQFGVIKWLTKSDNRKAGVGFVNQEYDYSLNGTPLSQLLL